jgi:type VI secretion system protein ImpA
MMVDVEALLAPVSDDNPVGEDLDGSPERYAVEEPFQTEQQADGDEEVVIDWRDASRRIVAQLAETKDLWLATYLMRVGARLGDLDAVVGGAQVGAGLLDRYWDTVHPQLDTVDFIGRKAPFEALTKLRDFLNPLKQVVLVQHPRLGRYTIADVQRFKAEGALADGYGMFEAALDDHGGDVMKEVRDKVDALTAAIRRSDAVLTANAVDVTSTNFEPTYVALAEIRGAIDAFVKEEEAPADAPFDLDSLDFGDFGNPAEGAGDGGGGGDFDLSGLDALLNEGSEAAPAAQPAANQPAAAGAGASGARGGGRRAGGPIATRAEAVAALEAVESYFQKNEPSSPVPAIIRRARSWIAMDFMALLQDLSPDSLSDVRKILGVQEANED